MPHFRFSFALLLNMAVLCLGADYRWPSPQYDHLEALLYEGRRGDGSSLASIVHPCRKRPDTGASIGAEWLRFVCDARLYHAASHTVSFSGFP